MKRAFLLYVESPEEAIDISMRLVADAEGGSLSSTNNGKADVTLTFGGESDVCVGDGFIVRPVTHQVGDSWEITGTKPRCSYKDGNGVYCARPKLEGHEYGYCRDHAEAC